MIWSTTLVVRKEVAPQGSRPRPSIILVYFNPYPWGDPSKQAQFQGWVVFPPA